MRERQMIAVSILLLLGLSVFFECRLIYGQVVHCPAHKDEVIREEQVAGAAEKDKLVQEEVDEKGNKVELWCIDGKWFGKRYVPKGGTPVWVGKCSFPNGRNAQDISGPDANKNGRIDEFEKISWYNVEPPPTGTHDWYYQYSATGPDKGKLLIWKTEGHWEEPYAVPNHVAIWYMKYFTDRVVDTDKTDAPSRFEDLKFKGVPIASPIGGTEGAAAPIFELQSSHEGFGWKYAITIPNLSGTGTSDDPYIGLPFDVVAGDILTIAGYNITNAYVSGSASLSEFGGWSVSNWGTNFVTYIATINTTLRPGEIVHGFILESSATGGDTGYVGYGTGLNSAGTTIGPVEEVRGGFMVAIDKFGLLSPYLIVASTIFVAIVGTAVYLKHVNRRKEKQ